jgi:autotransporter translocation and assembly factor TamB
LLSLAAPDLGLAGRFLVDLAVSGSSSSPAWNGLLRIENGRYRMAGYSFDEIDGAVRLTGTSGEIEGLRARVADGEAFVAGGFRLAGAGVKDFRLTLQGRRISVRAIPAMRLTVDADLVASGDESGNQLRGEITLLRGTYSKDVEVTLEGGMLTIRGGKRSEKT